MIKKLLNRLTLFKANNTLPKILDVELKEILKEYNELTKRPKQTLETYFVIADLHFTGCSYLSVNGIRWNWDKKIKNAKEFSTEEEALLFLSHSEQSGDYIIKKIIRVF